MPTKMGLFGGVWGCFESLRGYVKIEISSNQLEELEVWVGCSGVTLPYRTTSRPNTMW